MGDDQGFTLVELLLALVVIGLAIVAVIGGILTLVSASGIHRTQANVTTALNNVAETIKADAYVPCNTATYSLAGASLPTDIPPANVHQSIQNWNGSMFLPVGSCTTDGGLQEITITIQTTDKQAASGSLTIVKGNP